MRPAVSFSAYLVSLPFEFLHWWFVDATFNLLQILRFFLSFTYRFLAVNLIFKTFFKPWKNEYREGLTRFALFMGMFIKTVFLFFDLVFFSVLILVEGLILIAWLTFPLLVIWGLYAAIFS
jgi:hypothetical protein